MAGDPGRQYSLPGSDGGENGRSSVQAPEIPGRLSPLCLLHRSCWLDRQEETCDGQQVTWDVQPSVSNPKHHLTWLKKRAFSCPQKSWTMAPWVATALKLKRRDRLVDSFIYLSWRLNAQSCQIILSPSVRAVEVIRAGIHSCLCGVWILLGGGRWTNPSHPQDLQRACFVFEGNLGWRKEHRSGGWSRRSIWGGNIWAETLNRTWLWRGQRACQAGKCVHREREKPLEAKDCVGRCSVGYKDGRVMLGQHHYLNGPCLAPFWLCFLQKETSWVCAGNLPAMGSRGWRPWLTPQCWHYGLSCPSPSD